MEEVVNKKKMGEALLETLKSFSGLEGQNFLVRKVKKEIQYLERLETSEKLLQKDCSNMSHLKAVVDAAQTIENIDRFDAPVLTACGDRLTLDIMAENGMKWYKITNKSPKLLHDQFIYGSRSNRTIDAFAKLFVETSSLYEQMFVPPKIIFIFQQGISGPLAKHLEKLGVVVKGEILPDDLFQQIDSDDEEEMETTREECEGTSNTVNLDITCMLAYCSKVANGGAHAAYDCQIMSQQAANEQQKPVVPQIQKYMEGKRVIACTEAIEHFKTILGRIGGPEEQRRGAEFLQKIEEVEGVDLFQERLELGGRIKPLPRLVFGTGHAHRAPTITSNTGFISNCKYKGLRLAALIHEPRVLCEVPKKRSGITE